MTNPKSMTLEEKTELAKKMVQRKLCGGYDYRIHEGEEWGGHVRGGVWRPERRVVRGVPDPK